MILILVGAFLAAPLAMLAGSIRPRFAGYAGLGSSAFVFVAILARWHAGTTALEGEWIPSLGVRYAFHLDGLGALYSLLAAAIGFLVILYSIAYMPNHLRQENRPPEEQVRFYSLVLLFMAAMIAVTTSQDLLQLNLFWDLTAVTSYLLIGSDRHKEESRRASLVALVITTGTAVLLLLAVVLIYVRFGTTSLPELREADLAGGALLLPMALIATAALAKSAQVPLHFWLPRAMVAPTPVSAYLHSAAMVAAGVFLLSRVHFLIAQAGAVQLALLGIGPASIAVGSVIALTRDHPKQLLAYSTIAQYGYVVFLLGLGGEQGLAGAAFYVLAHALSKSGLFLAAGAAIESFHDEQLSNMGGLLRRNPVLGVASGICAAGLAALPLTIGFFKDELLFAASFQAGWIASVVAVGASMLTLAYTWHFWSSIFLGKWKKEPHGISILLIIPVVALAAAILLGGILSSPFTNLAEAAGSVIHGAAVHVDASYHLDSRAENLMALAAYGLGLAIILSRKAWARGASALARYGRRFGPAMLFHAGVRELHCVSDWLHRLEIKDVRHRVAAVLVPGACLIWASMLVNPSQQRFEIGALSPSDVPLAAALALAATAAVVTLVPTRHLAVVLASSTVSYSLTLVFAFLGAPNVALVALLIQTAFTLLLLSILRLYSRTALQQVANVKRRTGTREILVGLAAAVGSFALTWRVLSQPSFETVGFEYVQLTPLAHAKDVVTAIITDFRQVDTVGEITVLIVALTGIATLLRPKEERS